MQTNRLNVLIALVLIVGPLGTQIGSYLLSPICEEGTLRCYRHTLTEALEFTFLGLTFGFGALRMVWLTLIAYGVLLLIDRKLYRLPLKVLVALVIVFVPLGFGVATYLLNPICPWGTSPRCYTPAESLDAALSHWYWRGPRDLTLGTLGAYGLLLIGDRVYGRTHTVPSTFEPVTTTSEPDATTLVNDIYAGRGSGRGGDTTHDAR